jgi:hypothetical protein
MVLTEVDKLTTCYLAAAGGETGGLQGHVPEQLDGLDLLVSLVADNLTLYYLLLVVERLEYLLLIYLNIWMGWTYWSLL